MAHVDNCPGCENQDGFTRHNHPMAGCFWTCGPDNPTGHHPRCPNNPNPMKHRYLLAFYEIDRAYGGPEEGGWWFDTGQLVRVSKVFRSEDAAYRACGRANILLRLVQRSRRDVGSVLYDGGRYAAQVFEDTAPAFYPEARPRYE